MAALAAPPATADVTTSCRAAAAGDLVRAGADVARRGQRQAAGVPARHSPRSRQPAAGTCWPSGVSSAVAGRFQDQRAVPARRAPRALEVVCKASPHRADGGRMRLWRWASGSPAAAAMKRIQLVVTNVRLAVASGPGFCAESVRLRTARTLRVAARRSPHYGQPYLTSLPLRTTYRSARRSPQVSVWQVQRN
jgi:hypothetical protein